MQAGVKQGAAPVQLANRCEDATSPARGSLPPPPPPRPAAAARPCCESPAWAGWRRWRSCCLRRRRRRQQQRQIRRLPRPLGRLRVRPEAAAGRGPDLAPPALSSPPAAAAAAAGAGCCRRWVLPLGAAGSGRRRILESCASAAAAAVDRRRQRHRYHHVQLPAVPWRAAAGPWAWPGPAPCSAAGRAGGWGAESPRAPVCLPARTAPAPPRHRPRT